MDKYHHIRKISSLISKNQDTFPYCEKYIVLNIIETLKYINCMDNSCYFVINNRLITQKCIYYQLKILF